MNSESSYDICHISKDFLCEAAGCEEYELSEIDALDLNLKDDQHNDEHYLSKTRKIRKIENMQYIQNVTFISFSHNVIKKMEGLDKLTKLRDLNLAENSIECIECIQNLHSLERLNLNGNVIKRIPPTISSLSSLTTFRISRNRLNELSDMQYLGQLPVLSELRASDNPFCASMDEIISDPNSKWSLYEWTAIWRIATLMNLDNMEVTHYDHVQAQTILSSNILELGHNSPSTHQSTISSSTSVAKTAKALSRTDLPSARQATNLQSNERIDVAHVFSTVPVPRDADVQSPVQASPLLDSFAPATPLLEHQQRVGKLTSRLLSVEAQKEELGAQVLSLMDRLAVQADEGEQLRRQLAESQKLLQYSEERNHESTEALSACRSELERANAEVSGCRAAAEAQLREADLLRSDKDALATDCASLRAQLTARDMDRQERSLLDAVRPVVSSSALGRGGSAADDFSQGEARRELMAARTSISELNLTVERQQRDLASVMKELQSTRERLQERNELAEAQSLKEQWEQRQTAETELAAALSQVQVLREQLQSAADERDHYRDRAHRAEADLRLYMEATEGRQDQSANAAFSFRGSPPSSKRANASLFRANTERRTSQLGAIASDSDSDEVSDLQDAEANHASQPFNDRRFASRHSRNMPGRFSLSVLEQRAAEVMAHMLSEELGRAVPLMTQITAATATGGSRLVSTSSSFNADEYVTAAGLREACSIVALRLLHTSVQAVREEHAKESAGDAQQQSDYGSPATHTGPVKQTYPSPSCRKLNAKQKQVDVIPLSPFHVLGDRRYLARLVTETQAGVAALEDVASLRKEIDTLKRQADDMQHRCDLLHQVAAEKAGVVRDQEKRLEEGRSLLKDTEGDLVLCARRLEAARDDINSVESEYAISRRELEQSQLRLKECQALSQLEDRCLVQLRAKVSEVREQLATSEEQLRGNKEGLLRDEEEMRRVRSVANEEIRRFQADLHRVAQEFKAKQRSLEDAEKQRRVSAEEFEVRRREAEASLSALSRAHEDESRKLSAVREEISAAHLEGDQLLSRRRQLEHEATHAQEKLETSASRNDAVEAEARRRLDNLERKAQECEKRLRIAKGQVATLDGEQAVLRSSLDELRRQQSDLERTIDTRRRSADEELSQVHQVAQQLAREASQKKADLDLLRGAAETVATDLAMLERRHESVKRCVNEQELLLDNRKEGVRTLELDRDALRHDAVAVRKSLDALQHQVQMAKSQLEADGRILEDSKRKLSLCRDEEAGLLDSQAKLRQAVSQSRKELDDSQCRLDLVNAQCEREKRDLADVRAKRAVVEGDLHRLGEELRCAQQRHGEEDVRRVKTEAALHATAAELNRLTRELIAKEKEVEDSQRSDDDLKRQGQELKASLERLRVDSDIHRAALAREKGEVERLREERRQLTAEIRKASDDNVRAQQEFDRSALAVEDLRVQQSRLEASKVELGGEVAALRDKCRAEVQRMERLEQICANEETRLQALREHLSSAQSDCERVKSNTEQERHCVAEQRRLLKLGADELVRIQASAAQADRQLHDERQRAIAEMGQLEQAKASVNAHMFLVGEASKRQQRQVMPATVSPISKTLPVAQPFPVSAASANKMNCFAPFIGESTHSAIVKSAAPQSQSAVRAGVNVEQDRRSGGHHSHSLELSTLQRELESLRTQSATVLGGAQ